MTRSQLLFRFGGALVVFCLASSIVSSAQADFAKRRAARHAAMLAKYDRNGDGKISREERAMVKAEARAERTAAKAARAEAKAARKRGREVKIEVGVQA